ncbi:unnamed protein product [Fraxinus pennsylvanica]|uniref:Uncharacterized protein n=1 Tax=Fraxinus pennsylvanica TaxID=56036 RepID=A0AAD1YWQ9_9LAMI|nr:unnamed protein product [Fraxinus pennsylvanica]
MAAAGVHPKPLEELASFSDYCNPLLEFLAALKSDEGVILFSHSSREFNKQLDYMDSQLTFENGVDKLPTSLLFGPKFLSSQLYLLSPPEDLALANLLMRPVVSYDGTEIEKEMALSKENYGSVPRVYLICENDIIIKQRLQNWTIENNPCDEVKMISGADHMAMFSKPRELCSFLQEIAEKY